MDIEKLIKEEAPGNDEHDNEYSEQLQFYYDIYNDLSIRSLKELQKIARINYTGDHGSVADCMILNKLIEQIQNENKHNQRN